MSVCLRVCLCPSACQFVCLCAAVCVKVRYHYKATTQWQITPSRSVRYSELWYTILNSSSSSNLRPFVTLSSPSSHPGPPSSSHLPHPRQQLQQPTLGVSRDRPCYSDVTAALAHHTRDVTRRQRQKLYNPRSDPKHSGNRSVIVVLCLYTVRSVILAGRV
jgi:hypothetical protein